MSREATDLCFCLLYPTARWLLVKPEAQTPPTPSVETPKVGPFAQVVAFGASPCFNALAIDLLRHRPGAQPNCLRCAPQVGGVDSYCGLCCCLGRVGRNPLPAGFNALSVGRQKKSRFPVADTKENGFGMPEGRIAILVGVSVREYSRKRPTLSNVRGPQPPTPGGER